MAKLKTPDIEISIVLRQYNNNDSNNDIQSIFTELHRVLTLKAPITTAADDIHKYFLIVLKRK